MGLVYSSEEQSAMNAPSPLKTISGASRIPAHSFAVDPTAGGEGRRLVRGASLDRDLRPHHLDQPGRIGEGGGGVVRQAGEGAAHRQAARPGGREAELQPGVDLFVGLAASIAGEGQKQEREA